MTSELRRWLSAIGVLTSAVNSGHDLKMLLDQVAATARELLDLDFCGVMVPELDGKSLKIAGASGLSEEYIDHVNCGRRIRLDVNRSKGAPASRAFFSGEPWSVSDVSAEPDSMWTDVAREQGYRSILAVPLRSADGVLGTLNSYRTVAHDFQPEEVEQLTLLAEHATLALTSARIVNDLREQHHFIVRSEEIHERLLRVAVRSGGVSGIATALRELLGCHVVILDTSGEILSATGEPQFDFNDRQVNGRDEKLVGGEQSGLLRTEGEHAVIDVLLNGDVVANVWLLGQAEGLDRLGVRAAEHASVVLALELLRQRTAAEVEQRLRGELLADLLAGADPESRPIRDRANLMGHNLSVRHRMLVAVAMSNSNPPTVRSSTASEKMAERAASEAVRLTSHLRPRPLIAAVHDTVVALWPGGKTEQAAEQVICRAISMADSQVTAKVVTIQLSDNRIPDSYRVARGALSFAMSDHTAPDSLTLDDLGAVGILLQFADPAVLRRYANRILGAVDDYDAKNGTNLVSTLRVYLDRDLDRRATATHLVVHPNTVSQRLRRIEMLSGLELRSPRSILDARSALMLLDVVRAIDDPVA